MFQLFSGTTADEVWLDLATAFWEGDLAVAQDSRGGPTKDIGNVAISVSDPRQRWVVSRQPPLNPAFAIAEVVWILAGRDDSWFLNYFNRQLPRFAGTGVKYDGAYGHRLKKHLGIDQLERAYSSLRNCEHSRQVVLQIWDARSDMPREDGAPASDDVPCNIVSMLKIRRGSLEWTQVMRSNDLFRGLPHNFVQFTSLHEIMAGWLDVDLGTFHLVTDSLHVYEKDESVLANPSAVAMPMNEDSLMLTKPESDSAIDELASLVERIIDPDVTAPELVNLAGAATLPSSFSNLMYVLIGEGLRRRDRLDLADDVLQSCSSAVLRQLWHRWLERMGQLHLSGGGS